MSARILVTGATGNVGYEVVRALSPLPVRAAVSDPASKRARFADTVSLVKFDFRDPATYAAAFNGIESVFLVRPPQLANVKRDFVPAIAAAKAAGVQHIVFLSLLGVEKQRIVPHYKIEQAILESGLDWTFLRASFFMQNLSSVHLDELRQRNEIAVPVGQARTSFIDVRDIGAVAARTLTDLQHRNRAYELTGAEASGYEDVAATMSTVLGRRIRYTNPSLPGFVIQQLRAGRPLMFTLVMAALYTVTRAGSADVVTDDVARILGRPPVLLCQFLEDYCAVWNPI